MAAQTMLTFDPALKVLYSTDTVENETYADAPLHAALPKNTEFYGKSFVEALIYANPQGGGVTIASAQAAAVGTSVAGFTLVRRAYYGVAQITNEVIMASANDKGALLQALKTEIDGVIRMVGRQLAIMEYGDGSGVLGIAGTPTASTGTTFTFPLTQIDQITNFEKGMSIAIFTAAQTAGVYTGAVPHGFGTISALDRQLGTMTITAASGLAGAAGDILVQGTGTTVVSTVGTDNTLNNVVAGVGAWIPQTTPTSALFFGVDRSVEPTRLGGVRSDQRGVAIDEALINGARDVGREGGSPDMVFLDYLNWGNLVKILGAAVRYMEVKVNATIGFTAVLLNGPKGQIKVLPDRNCPPDRAYMLTMRTWKLRSLKAAPMLLETDGNKMLRISNADSVEVRVGYYAQLGCSAPAYNANIQLA